MRILKRRFSVLEISAAAGAGLIAILTLAFLAIWSGAIDVAANRGHWTITRAAIEFALHSSVRTHSMGHTPPDLQSDDLIALGGRHFAAGCAVCHGTPGSPAAVIFDQMLPKPPDLSGASGRWKPRELFWIVKHGLKFTGMPAWPTQRRDDEVWSLVAFLLSLPDVGSTPLGSDGDFRRLSPAAAFVSSGAQAERCEACHTGAGKTAVSTLIPVLSGRSPAYLQRALLAYRSGQRHSGIMQHAASRLSDGEIEALSQHFSQQESGESHETPSVAASMERGRQIVEHGLPAAGVPACLSCHERGNPDLFPDLHGQHSAYIVAQLKLFKDGTRAHDPLSRIMGAVAQRLQLSEMEDVAAYYAAPDGGGAGHD